jgi:hypothetical protein
MTRRSFLEVLAAACSAGLGVRELPASSAPALAPPVASPVWLKVKPRQLDFRSNCSFSRGFDDYHPLHSYMDGSLELFGIHKVFAGDTMAVRMTIGKSSFAFAAIIEKAALRSCDEFERTDLEFAVFRAPRLCTHHFELVDK